MDRTPHINPLLSSNPLSGLLPVMLLLTLPVIFSLSVSMIVSLAVWLSGLLWFVIRRKSLSSMPTMIASSFVLPLSCLLFASIRGAVVHPLYFQGLILALFVLISAAQSFLRRENRIPGMNISDFSKEVLHKRLVMVEHERIDKRLRLFAIIAFAGILAIYLQYGRYEAPPVQFLLTSVVAGVMWLSYIIEVVSLSMVKSKLQKEEWLPLVDNSGNTVGRVPRSDLDDIGSMIQSAQLPMVRLVALCNDMIFLEHRELCDLCDSDCIDTPFTDWIKGNGCADEVAQALIDERFCGVKRSCPRHLVTYNVEHSKVSCQVHLYAVQVAEPDLLTMCCNPSESKWWPVDQVMEMLKGQTFSELLKNEMPYLKHTIVLAERIRKRRQERRNPSYA